MDKVMGVLMAVFGGLLLGGVLFRWEWLLAGAKYRRLAAAHPLVATIVYGAVGLFFLVAGLLHVAGLWPEGGRFWGR